MRLKFRSVDPSPTPAGRVHEVAKIRGSRGVGWGEPRRYPTRALVLLVHGGGIYRDERGVATEVRPGDLILVHPALGHAYGPPAGGDWEEYYVCYEGAVFDALELAGVGAPERPVLSLGDPAPWRAKLEAAFPPEGRPPPSAARAVGWLVAFLLEAQAAAGATAKTTETAAWVARARRLLDAPGRDARDLAAVARACGMGYEAFRKRFAAQTGEGPARYRLKARVAHAQRLMLERDLPDRAVAEALGFCDEFHFSKTFKRVAGVSPRTWRESRR